MAKTRETIAIQQEAHQVAPAQAMAAVEPQKPSFAAQKKKKKKRLGIILGIVAVVVILIAAFIFYSISQAQKLTKTVYQTAKVDRGTIVKSLSGTGQLASGATKDVDPEVSGTVTNLQVKLGDVVAKGDLLFSIDNDDLADTSASAADALDAAKASLSSAQESLDAAQSQPTVSADKLMKSAQSASAASAGSSGISSSALEAALKAQGLSLDDLAGSGLEYF